MDFDCRIKTTASYQSQGINLQNGVRLFRYSYWLLRNFTVNFDDQKLKDMFSDEGHCGRSILQNGNPSHSFFARYVSWESLGQISRQSVKSLYRINYFKGSTLAEKRSRFFSLLKVYIHFTPLLHHISTLWMPPASKANRITGDLLLSPLRLLVMHQKS